MIAKLVEQFIDLPFLVVDPLILGFDSLVQFTLVLRVLLESSLQVCQLFLEKGSLPFQLCCQQGGFSPFAQKFAKGEVKCGEFCKVGVKGMWLLFYVGCLSWLRHSGHGESRKILGASASLPLPLQLSGLRAWLLKKK